MAAAVREQVRNLADWIKLGAPADREELVAAAIEEAHSLGAPVAIDSYRRLYRHGRSRPGSTRSSIRSPDRQGDSADEEARHCIRPDDRRFRQSARGRISVAGIPTGGFYHTHSRRFAINQQDHLKRVSEAYRAGVPIGVGTDIPFENECRYPDAYFRELDYLKQAGLTNAEVLASGDPRRRADHADGRQARHD
jgi:hypothetical protein